MAKRVYDVCVGTKGKDDKTYWNKVGVVLKNDKGYSLKMESIPVAWDGWAALFEPKEKEQPQQQNGSRTGGADKMRDDLPWRD